MTTRTEALKAGRSIAGWRCLAWGALDSLVWATAVYFATWLRYLYVTSNTLVASTAAAAALAAGLHLLLGRVSGLYRPGQILGSYDEVLSLVRTAALATVLFLGLVVLAPAGALVPRTVPLIAGFSALVWMLALRLVIRSIRARRMTRGDRKPIVIVGAGPTGRLLVHNLLQDRHSTFLPVAVLDEDPAKRSLKIEGVRVAGAPADLVDVAEKYGAQHVVIALREADPELVADVRRNADAHGIRTLVLPPISDLEAQNARISDIRDINVEDLLGRRRVSLDEAAIARAIGGRVVLVTGAGGSIGSELCRQIQRFGPSRLVLLDRDESTLQAVQLSLRGHGLLDSDNLVLADIRDRAALTAVMLEYRPSMVFHAAALKHLPLLERYPEEAWKSNVLGTLNVLEAATHVDVEVFVNISTDKAADPTSVLGYSKRITERLTASFSMNHPGRFISVRFGNVLGSRGSVLPAFTEQIRGGHDVTVTHPDVERYFMLIPEASQLVLQAAVLGRGGEVMVLDMGKPVRILDIAQALIHKSGRADIDIRFTGLRPGEKLTEDLFSRTDEQCSTGHPLVTCVQVPPLTPQALPTLPTSNSASSMRVVALETPHHPDTIQSAAMAQSRSLARLHLFNIRDDDHSTYSQSQNSISRLDQDPDSTKPLRAWPS